MWDKVRAYHMAIFYHLIAEGTSILAMQGKLSWRCSSPSRFNYPDSLEDSLARHILFPHVMT